MLVDIFFKVRLVSNAILTAMGKPFFFGIILFLAGTIHSAGQSIEAVISYQTSQHFYLKVNQASALEVDSVFLQEQWLTVVAASSQSLVVEKKSISLLNGASISFLPSSKTPSSVPQVPEVTLTEALEVPMTPESEVSTVLAPVKFKSEYRGKIGYDFYSAWDTDRNPLLRSAQRWGLSSGVVAGNHQLNASIRGTARQYYAKPSSDLRWNIYEATLVYQNPLGVLQVGRQVPRYASSLGSLDGISVSVKLPLLLHFITGYRPDYQSFGMNTNQDMYGVFISTPKPLGKRNVYGSVGVASFYGLSDQGVRGMDRRLLYQQISANLSNKLSWFSSMEWDTYIHPEGQAPESVLKLTGLYASLNYQSSKRGRFFASFDNRSPRIFYQQFDHELEQLLFDLGIQTGFRLRYSHRVSSSLNLSSGVTYRKQSTSDTPFGSILFSLRWKPWFTKQGHLTLNGTASSNSNYSTQIAQIQYSDRHSSGLYWQTYARYLHYQYPGASVSQSDRLYLGMQGSKTWKAVELFVRLEGSIRNNQWYPGVHCGVNYLFTPRKS